MDQEKAVLEQQYKKIMETAAEVAPEQPVLPAALSEAAYFFPWEYSPYSANATTTAEIYSAQG
jgi:hypothetical protein